MSAQDTTDVKFQMSTSGDFRNGFDLVGGGRDGDGWVLDRTVGNLGVCARQQVPHNAVEDGTM